MVSVAELGSAVHATVSDERSPSAGDHDVVVCFSRSAVRAVPGPVVYFLPREPGIDDG